MSLTTTISSVDDLSDQELITLIKRVYRRLSDPYEYRCIAPVDGHWKVISNQAGMWTPHITVRACGSISIF